MSDANPAGFGKFVPGFDFLQGLAKGQAAQIPGLGNWVAPTLDPQELDKRISELKSVQFWLDQNAAALKATIQALEVQKMTLATLKGMNLDVNALAQAFKFPAATPAKPQAVVQPAAAPAREKPAASSGKPAAKSTPSAAAAAVDPMQLWGSLTQQFQQIATGALQEAARQAAAVPANAAKSGAVGAGAERTGASKAARKTRARRP